MVPVRSGEESRLSLITHSLFSALSCLAHILHLMMMITDTMLLRDHVSAAVTLPALQLTHHLLHCLLSHRLHCVPLDNITIMKSTHILLMQRILVIWLDLVM